MGNMGTGRGSDGPLPERLISLVVDARLGPAAMHGLDKITLALEEKPIAEKPQSSEKRTKGTALATCGPATPATSAGEAVEEKPKAPKEGTKVAIKVKSLYGFSPNLAPFVGKSPAEQVALLQEWGNTVVFGGYQDHAFVEAVHAAEMRIYAEFGCFVGADWWEMVRASRPVTAEGQPLEKEGWYCGVNPATPQVRQERLQALEKLVTDYAIDGVWLDFIRWPCHWGVHDPYMPHTSFDSDTLARFSQDTGIAMSSGGTATVARTLLDRHGAEWTAWRCEQITSWVAEAKGVLKRLRPNGILGLFGVPWRLSDYDGAILKIIGQDYSALGQHVDVFSPMVYHLMCGFPPGWIGEVTEEIQALSGKPVWPIIQSVDKPTPLSAEGYAQALDIALQSAASDGVLVFTMKGALDEAKLAVTRERFGGTAIE